MQPSGSAARSDHAVDRELRELSEGLPRPLPRGSGGAPGGPVLLPLPGRPDREPHAPRTSPTGISFIVGREAGAELAGRELDRDDGDRREEAVSGGLLLLDAARRRVHRGSDGRHSEVEGGRAGDQPDSEQLLHAVQRCSSF